MQCIQNTCIHWILDVCECVSVWPWIKCVLKQQLSTRACNWTLYRRKLHCIYAPILFVILPPRTRYWLHKYPDFIYSLCNRILFAGIEQCSFDCQFYAVREWEWVEQWVSGTVSEWEREKESEIWSKYLILCRPHKIQNTHNMSLARELLDNI